MQNFRKLRVWQAAMDVTVFTYKVTRKFPREEQFGLTSQMREAAISVAANISEGAGRGSKKDSKRFLQIAHGSACELQSHYTIAADLEYVSAGTRDDADGQIVVVRRMLAGLMARLK